MKLVQLCPTICNPVNYSSPCVSVHGILQARILEWVALPFTRASLQVSNLGLLHCKQILYCLSHLGSPSYILYCYKLIFPNETCSSNGLWGQLYTPINFAKDYNLFYSKRKQGTIHVLFFQQRKIAYQILEI